LGFLIMNFVSINEDRVIWLALMASLLMHGLFFIFSGKTFIQQAQFSVHPSSQMVEVSIKEIKDPEDALQKEDGSIKALKRINKAKQAVHSVSSVRVKANPDYFQNSPPEYPKFAQQMRQEGLVLLSVDVDRAGDTVNVEIIQSSGYRLLDQAALMAVRHWRFQPGSIGNVPVESTVTVPIRFRLEK